MTVPGFDAVMLPLLCALADGGEHRLRDLVSAVADALAVPEAERSERTQAGDQTKLDSRVRWREVYLGKAGLLESTARGVVRITPRGREALREAGDRIDYRFLTRYAEFRQFRRRTT